MKLSREIYSKIFCEESERENCLDAVGLILNLSIEANEIGLLGIKNKIEKIPSPLLQKGFELILNGTEPDEVRQQLDGLLIISGYEGKQLLEEWIFCEGILMIQQADFPGDIVKVLTSIIGDEWHPIAEIKFAPMLENWYEKRANILPYSKGSLLDALINYQDPDFYRKITTHFDLEILAHLLAFAPPIVQMRFFEHLDIKKRARLLHKIELIGSSPPESFTRDAELNVLYHLFSDDAEPTILINSGY